MILEATQTTNNYKNIFNNEINYSSKIHKISMPIFDNRESEENKTINLSKNNKPDSNELIMEEQEIFVEKVINISGADFNVDYVDNEVMLTHKNWALVGSGSTLYDAIKDLRAEGKDLVKNYMGLPNTELTTEAIRLRDFLLNFI